MWKLIVTQFIWFKIHESFKMCMTNKPTRQLVKLIEESCFFTVGCTKTNAQHILLWLTLERVNWSHQSLAWGSQSRAKSIIKNIISKYSECLLYLSLCSSVFFLMLIYSISLSLSVLLFSLLLPLCHSCPITFLPTISQSNTPTISPLLFPTQSLSLALLPFICFLVFPPMSLSPFLCVPSCTALSCLTAFPQA